MEEASDEVDRGIGAVISQRLLYPVILSSFGIAGIGPDLVADVVASKDTGATLP